MSGLGNKLKRAREEKGYSLEQVEEVTKIRKKYIVALENEEFESIPGKTYARGFLRNYAKFLKMDPDELLEEYETYFGSVHEEPELTELSEGEAPPETRKDNRLLRIGIIAGIVVILIVINVVIFGDPGEEPPPREDRVIVDDPENDENDIQVPVNDINDNDDEEENDEIYDRVDLEISVIQDSCWMRVVVDGNEVFQATLEEGESKTFTGEEEITITLGNAGGVSIVYNNEEIPPLGESGEVVTRTFTLPDTEEEPQ